MSQLDKVFGHLTRAPLTPMQALSRYGVFRLAARIRDLRARGHAISTQTVTRKGKSFARYALEKGSRAGALAGRGSRRPLTRRRAGTVPALNQEVSKN